MTTITQLSADVASALTANQTPASGQMSKKTLDDAINEEKRNLANEGATDSMTDAPNPRSNLGATAGTATRQAEYDTVISDGLLSPVQKNLQQNGELGSMHDTGISEALLASVQENWQQRADLSAMLDSAGAELGSLLDQDGSGTLSLEEYVSTLGPENLESFAASLEQYIQWNDSLIASGEEGNAMFSSAKDILATLDTIDGEIIVGTAGDDTLTGTDKKDLILGLAGDDVINGQGGDDIILGGAGDDAVAVNAGDGVIDPPDSAGEPITFDEATNTFTFNNHDDPAKRAQLRVTDQHTAVFQLYNEETGKFEQYQIWGDPHVAGNVLDPNEMATTDLSQMDFAGQGQFAGFDALFDFKNADTSDTDTGFTFAFDGIEITANTYRADEADANSVTLMDNLEITYVDPDNNTQSVIVDGIQTDNLEGLSVNFFDGDATGNDGRVLMHSMDTTPEGDEGFQVYDVDTGDLRAIEQGEIFESSLTQEYVAASSEFSPEFLQLATDLTSVLTEMGSIFQMVANMTDASGDSLADPVFGEQLDDIVQQVAQLFNGGDSDDGEDGGVAAMFQVLQNAWKPVDYMGDPAEY